MNDLIFKMIIIKVCPVVVILYLGFIVWFYGQQRSISYVARLFRRDGWPFLPYVFILFGLLPMGYVAQSIPMFISTLLIGIIGTMTGYNPNYEKKIQDTLHVTGATGSMVGLIVDVVFRIVKYFPYKQFRWISIVLIIAAGLVILYTAYMHFMKRKNRTWKIEVAFLFLLFSYVPFVYIYIDYYLQPQL